MTAVKTQRDLPASGLTPEKFATMTAVLLLETHKPGFQRKMRTDSIVAEDDEVDRSLVNVHKDLLDKSILEEINREDHRIKAYLKTRAVTCTMLAERMYAITLPLVEEVDDEVDAYKARRAAWARLLVRDKYAQYKADAEKRLGPKHFNPAEYPTEADLEASFWVRTRWLTFNVPSALEEASSEIYQREMQRLRIEVNEAGTEMRDGLRMVAAGLIDAAVERLGNDPETGKPNRFNDSTILKLNDFLDTFAKRDLTDDREMLALVEKARGVLRGVKPDELRKVGPVRQQALKAVTEIKQTLVKMDVVSARTRKLRRPEEV